MKKVGQLLNELQQRRFVSREKELRMMQQELCANEDGWRMLHINGPGGIGKTALLKAFQRTVSDRLILFMDGRTYSHPVEFVIALRSLLAEHSFPATITEENDTGLGEMEAEKLNYIAEETRGVVLLLDSMDRCSAVETWLRECWLPLLNLRVKVCSAGRYRLDESQLTESGWNSIVRNIRLAPLNKKEIALFMTSFGITSDKLRDAIERFSGGIPLALSLACESALQHGQNSFLEGRLIKTIIASMDRSLFYTGDESSLNKRLLAAASMVWRFDQDMLEVILDEEIPHHLFSDFCSLPYVTIVKEGGYCILDAVRKWMKAELTHRAPETYTLFRKRAVAEVEKRWMDHTANDEAYKMKLRFEKLFLLSNSFLQSYYFTGDGQGFEIRPARQEDLPLLGPIYQQGHFAFPPYLPDDTRQHSFIEAVWKASPSSFRVFQCGEKVAGFHICLPLNEKMRNLLAENVILQNYLKQSPPMELEYLNWIGAIAPEFHLDAFSLFIQHILCHSMTGKLVFTTLPFEGPVDSMCQLGFERLPWADYRSPGGLHYQACRVDLRKEDFFNRIQLVEENDLTTMIAPESRIQLTKQVLEHYHNIHGEPTLLQTIRRLFSGSPSEHSDDMVAIKLRSLANKSLDRLAAGKTQEQMQERILRLFYIDQIGSHETIAVRLGLPITTYYRYLKKGIGQLANDMLPSSFAQPSNRFNKATN